MAWMRSHETSPVVRLEQLDLLESAIAALPNQTHEAIVALRA